MNAPSKTARDFSAELEAARSAGDWSAHARIWEERRAAEVDSDTASIAAGFDKLAAMRDELFAELDAAEAADVEAAKILKRGARSAPRPVYTIEWTVKYPGGHERDPGYRAVRAHTDVRQFSFICDPDGSKPRGIMSRTAYAGENSIKSFRALSDDHAAKRAPDLEAAIKAHLKEIEQ